MTAAPDLLLAVAAAYLLGSFPTGFLVGRARGVDLRAHGSGNIGATNAFRVLGRAAGSVVLVVDALKGAGAVFATRAIVPESAREWAAVAAGLAAILGHNYTVWLRFRGGKGVATSAGVLCALAPGPLGVSAATWLIVAWMSRYVSLASIASAVALPLGAVILGVSPPVRAFTILAAGLAIARHRANIRRLLAGTEAKIGKKTPPKTPTGSEPPKP